MFLAVKRICTKKFAENLSRYYTAKNNFSLICSNHSVIAPISNHISKNNLQFCRFKSKGKNKSKNLGETETETEDSDKDFLDSIQDKYSKTLKVNVVSMRLDVILKAALGLSRNKLETTFYESRIRLNGEKVLKKSVHIQEGDEIDVIKGSNVNNKDLLTVAKVEILSAIGKDENIAVKIRRCKSITVDNYDGNNRWNE